MSLPVNPSVKPEVQAFFDEELPHTLYTIEREFQAHREQCAHIFTSVALLRDAPSDQERAMYAKLQWIHDDLRAKSAELDEFAMMVIQLHPLRRNGISWRM